MNIFHKHRRMILFLILLLSFLLRFYGAKTLPLNSDEIGDAKVARTISLRLDDLRLPLVDKDPEDAGLILHRYFIRIGWDLFGESNLSARLPYVILGVLTILMLYLIVTPALGTGVALLACFLLSIDQFHIGVCRVTDDIGTQLFLISLSLYFFCKAVREKKPYCFLINGLILGVGFWVKETMPLFIFIYILYLIIVPEYRFWLKRKIFWLSFLISGLIMAPQVCAILSTANAPRYYYIATNTTLGLSLNATTLYLGELILLLIKPNYEFFRQVYHNLNAQLPMENFMLGGLTLCAVIFFLREKDRFIRLMTLAFAINFITFTFIRSYNELNSVWAMNSFGWSCFGFVPGLILAAYFMVTLVRRYGRPAAIMTIFFILYIFIRSVDIATYPIAAYFPVRDHCIGEVQEWLDSIGFLDRQRIRSISDVKLLKSIYAATGDRPAYKRAAALRMTEILEDQGKVKESQRYLDYLHSQKDMG